MLRVYKWDLCLSLACLSRESFLCSAVSNGTTFPRLSASCSLIGLAKEGPDVNLPWQKEEAGYLPPYLPVPIAAGASALQPQPFFWDASTLLPTPEWA